jgi:hypothetical protein
MTGMQCSGSGIRDPVLFRPWIRIRNPGWKNLDLESLETVYWVKNTYSFSADPDPGSCQTWIRDGINRIRDKHPGSAALCGGTNKKIAILTRNYVRSSSVSIKILMYDALVCIFSRLNVCVSDGNVFQFLRNSRSFIFL